METSSSEAEDAQALHQILTAEAMATRAVLRQIMASLALLSMAPEAYLGAVLQRAVEGLAQEARANLGGARESPIYGMAAERLAELMRSVPGWREIDGGKLN